jgi:iron complex outermembrane receptor protein
LACADDSLSEVIVTAQRRSTDMQNTPVAVTAVTSRTLDQSFVVNLAGLNATVPSVEITKASGFENLVTIRGVGSETPENGLTTVPGVSLFVDGVYIANTISLDQTLFDIQDIEVLRGPQGALYGQSSIGGAINIQTRQPVLHSFDASGDFSFGTYSLFRERAEVNIPLGDHWALRVSGQKFDHDGFTKDLAIPGFGLDDAHDGSEKASLLWKPTNTFTAILTEMIYRSDQHGDAQKNVDEFSTLPALGYAITDPREVYQDYPSHFSLTSQLYHLNLQWDLPYFSVRSVSAYQGLDHVQREDSSRSAFAISNSYDDVAAWNTHVHNYTEEFDLLSATGAKLEWIAGGFLLYQSSEQFVLEYDGFGGLAPAPAQLSSDPANLATSPPANLAYGNISRVLRRSYSLFAQGNYHVADNFRITAGARINIDNFTDDSLNIVGANFGGPSAGLVVNAKSDSVPTWRIETDYDLSPNNMIYASYARGYKPGGANGRTASPPPPNTPVIAATFDPETNDAFELGSKNLFFDKALRINVAAFFYNHKNFQYIETSPVPFQQGISDIPEVRDYGTEFEVNYAGLDKRFHLNGNLALEKGEVVGNYRAVDSTIANPIEAQGFPSPCAFGGAYFSPRCWAFVEAAATNIKGNQPPAMPQVSGSINASYTLDAPGGSLTPRIEFIYRGSEWARVFNVPGLDSVAAYGVTNVNLEYLPQNAHWRVSLAVTNLFNANGINSKYTDPYGTGQTSLQYIPPRQIIGTVAYSL